LTDGSNNYRPEQLPRLEQLPSQTTTGLKQLLARLPRLEQLPLEQIKPKTSPARGEIY